MQKRELFERKAPNRTVSIHMHIQSSSSTQSVWLGFSVASLWPCLFPLPLFSQCLFSTFSLSLHIHLIPSWPPPQGPGFNLCSQETALVTGEQHALCAPSSCSTGEQRQTLHSEYVSMYYSSLIVKHTQISSELSGKYN